MQVRGRTKSLFSTMKKAAAVGRHGEGAGRGRDEIYDLLGMRIVVAPLQGTPPETAAIASHAGKPCMSLRGSIENQPFTAARPLPRRCIVSFMWQTGAGMRVACHTLHHPAQKSLLCLLRRLIQSGGGAGVLPGCAR